MKLPKNYFENLTTTKYREYLKLLPNLQQDNARIITTLILTFTAMSFFGVFAINPTLSTILTLRKQLSDSIAVHEKLETKISALSNLQQQYNLIEPDLPTIFNAIPKNPQAPILLGQIITVAQKTNIKTTSLSVSNIQLVGEEKTSDGATFIFSLEADGQYNDLLNFTKSLTKIDRIISIDSITLSKVMSNNLVLNLRGRGYFKKDL